MDVLKKNSKILYSLVLFFILTGSLGYYSMAYRKSTRSKYNNAFAAYEVMENFVMQRLKAPGTAKFPSKSEGRLSHVTPLRQNQYKITSWVESRESAGLTVKRCYVGEIKQLNETEWELVSLVFIR